MVRIWSLDPPVVPTFDVAEKEGEEYARRALARLSTSPTVEPTEILRARKRSWML